MIIRIAASSPIGVGAIISGCWGTGGGRIGGITGGEIGGMVGGAVRGAGSSGETPESLLGVDSVIVLLPRPGGFPERH